MRLVDTPAENNEVVENIIRKRKCNDEQRKSLIMAHFYDEI